MSQRTQLVLVLLVAVLIAAVGIGLVANRGNEGRETAREYRESFR